MDDDNQIIAGHGRAAAAKLLEMDEVPTVRLAHLSPTKKRAYILADNRLAEKAGWIERYSVAFVLVQLDPTWKYLTFWSAALLVQFCSAMGMWLVGSQPFHSWIGSLASSCRTV